MSFWSTETIIERVPSASIISNYNEAHIKHGAYELTMGAEAYISDKPLKYKLTDGDDFKISPGHFAHLLTEESVSIPADTLAFISIKAGKKLQGLVNVSGFHVDPGFSGKLTFSVYNAGTKDIYFTRGERTFLIWFSDLDQQTADVYRGKSQNKASLTSEDGSVFQGKRISMPIIDERVSRLEHFAKWCKGIISLIVIPLVLGCILLNIPSCSKRNELPIQAEKSLQSKKEKIQEARSTTDVNDLQDSVIEKEVADE